MRKKKKFKLKINSYILFCIAVCLVSACSGPPSYVLSEKQMEDVLYDLYLAESEIKQNQPVFRQDSLLKEQLLQSVFDKNRIYKQEFDTSLVWYNSNLDRYIKINERLEQRYTDEIARLRAEVDKTQAQVSNVDSSYIYHSYPFTLSAYRQAIHPFIVEDSLLLAKDNRYSIKFLAMGIHHSGYPIFTLHLASIDTVFVFQDTLRNNTWYTKSYSAPGRYPVQSIYGSFYLPLEAKNPVRISDFGIIPKNPRASSGTIRRQPFKVVSPK